MSSHSAIFDAHGVAVLSDYMGDADAVSYQSANPDDDPIVVNGIVGPELTARRKGKNGELENVRQRSVALRDSHLARSAVQANGTMAVGGRTYAIAHVGDLIGELYEVELEAVAKGEVTREGYRR